MNDHPLFPEVDAEIAAEEVSLVTRPYERPAGCEFTVNGWAYSTEAADYSDNRKLDHFVSKDGKTIEIDWSPYQRMDPEAVALWFALGCPPRQGGGPLNDRHLMHLAKCRLERAVA